MMIDRQITVKYPLNLSMKSTMNTGSDWYNGIVQKIAGLKNTLDQKDYKRFRLDSLSSVAQRVDQFSSECTECMSFREDIDRLIKNAGDLAQGGDRELRKAHLSDLNKTMNKMVFHLRRQHRLVTEGYYMALGTALGMAVGLAIGIAAFDNQSLGMAIGIGGGVAIGAALDTKAKKEDRVLYTRATTRFSRLAWALLIAGLLVMLIILAFIFFMRRNQCCL
jgi:hypothetical protein